MQMTKNFALVLLAFTASLALTFAFTPSEYLNSEFISKPHHFGGIHLKKDTIDGSESIVHLPPKALFREPAHMQRLRDQYLFYKNNPDEVLEAKNDALLNCEDDGRPEFFKLVPLYIGTFTPENTTF